MTRADVAIVGGGPAGAWAALKLARMGARVAIFDPSHPREKPCGGGVTGRALELIAAELGALPFKSIVARTARLERAMKSPAEAAERERRDAVSLPLLDNVPRAASPLVVASRRELDGALLQAAIAAGAELIAERVSDVGAGPNGVAVRTRHRAYAPGFLLGADGANSLVRRRLSTAFTREQISIGTGYFLHGWSSSEVVIRWVANPPGYLWSFPRPDHLAVGICAQPEDESSSARLRELTCQWIGSARLAPDTARLERYSWPIPTLSVGHFDRLPLAAERWMLLGDAAGLVDPLTREGIYYALISAEAAAAAIASDTNPATGYRQRLIGGVLPELRRAARLKASFFTAGFSRLLIRALCESEAIRGTMRDLIAGRQPYIGLRRRLLRTGRLDLALQVMRHRAFA